MSTSTERPRRSRRRLLVAVAAIALIILATAAAAVLVTSPELRARLGLPGAYQTAEYDNPVLDQDFPDPAVLLASDGWYYAYATQTISAEAVANIQVARSRDLVAWEWRRDALPVRPRWANTTQNFWAPHVVERDGRYVMYFSAEPDPEVESEDGGFCLATATADSPDGRFTASEAPLRCGAGFMNIDPMAFQDPQSGKWLLYWGSGFGPLQVQELAGDGLTFAPGSEPAILFYPNCRIEYECLVEGAWVVYREPWYYLYYSGDDCCTHVNYAVLVARSQDPLGPFERLDEATGSEDSSILRADDEWDGPGHNAVVTDDSGVDWLLYHAIDRERPHLDTGDPNDEAVRRPMLIDPIEYVDGWPRVLDGTPSGEPRAGPQLLPP